VQRHGAGAAFAVDSATLGLASGDGRPLPEALRGKMEAALGADFSAVRVHVGPQAERIGAVAFTFGSDIYFAPGRYQPHTMHGQQLLGHELAHVVQQRAGRVKNPLGSRLAVVQDHALEAEADRLGRQAATHRVAAPVKMKLGGVQRSSPARVSAAIIRPERPDSAQPQRFSIPASRTSPQRMASVGLPVPSPGRATGVVQGYVGLFKEGESLFKWPWKLNSNKDKLISDGKYPHLTILLTHLNEYNVSGVHMRGLSFNQFHYSETHDDPNRVTFIEASPGKWQPLEKGQNYEKAKKAANTLMTLIGGQLDDSVFDTWGKRRVASIRPDPEENQNVFPLHDLAYQ
jgi:hypothetical protein